MINYNKLTNVLSKKINKDLRKIQQYYNKDTYINIRRFNTEIGGSFNESFEIVLDFQDFEQEGENNERNLWTLLAGLLNFDNEVKTIYRNIEGVKYEILIELTSCEENQTFNIRYFYNNYKNQ